MKPEAHREITAKAVDIFTTRSRSGFGQKLSTYADDVAKGSVEADRFPVFDRATNWHFYRENKLLKATRFWGLFMVHPTSDHILGKRVKSLSQHIQQAESAPTPDKKDRALRRAFELAGRALHHIQDMSTPSHITPIYHGPDLPFNQIPGAWSVTDHYEEFTAGKTVMRSGLGKVTVSEDEIDRIRSRAAGISLTGLYEEAAKRSLDIIFNDPASSFIDCTVNGKPSRIPLTMFWQKHSQSPDGGRVAGFGSFGPLEKVFDNPGRNIRDGDGNSYSFEADTLEKFCEQLFRKMVQDSLLGLFVVEKMMQSVN
ncbi:MAG: hypothetical protein RQ867_05830 [Mariprofundaceae bacterium]|nr:hypothetical protein [Mariprofundaceae bacterium]